MTISGSGRGIRGDFDEDGKPDLVWQNDGSREVSVWYMGGPQGNSFLGWNYLNPAPLHGWQVVSTSDFNGDGKPDLVWQNDASREVSVWYMGGSKGNTFLGWNYLNPTPLHGWHVVSADDFNADGKPDLVWQNDTSREVSVWYMGGAQGNTFLGWNYLSPGSLYGWQVVSTSDFNGDGKPDLVWQNDASREVSVWYMGGSEGNTFLGWNYLNPGPLYGWQAVN
jgi:serralysin